MSFRAFLFDLDGTLIDTDPLQFQLWKHIVNEWVSTHTSSHSVDTLFYEQCIRGRTDDEIWNSIQAHFNIQVDVQDRVRWTTWKQEEFLRRIDETVPIKGGREFMTRISDDRTFIGIVTNSKQTVAERLIDRLGIANLVDLLITADNCPEPKPSPAPYQMALKELDVLPSHTVIFEDSVVGIQSALGVCPRRIYIVQSSGHESSGHESVDHGSSGNLDGVLYGIKDYTDITLMTQP